ncbi:MULTISPECIES: hypothetical protein [Phyllobacteriaceae]|jgi:hypothetical protein|nr:hypothetical protein [Mesorhizobium sp. YL-MeA3-2017]MBN9232739.1 hypothetical protein [Mesorhizobium sp.]MDQ0330338.1 hypothetical protein [Mesorhizobium sp. YL-MeA3-2017]
MPRKASPDQGDLFFSPVYPSRVADQSIDLTGFRGKLKRGMSRALKDCAHERPEVAMRIATALGQDSFSLATLNAYTAESNETHDISLVRFKAFVRATRATWLWDLVVADDGLTMLIGDEARLAEIARVQQERAALDDKLKELKAKPVHILRRDRA